MATESNGDEGALAQSEALPPSTLAPPPLIPPLQVSGMVVTKPDLVQALRIYLPQLVDIVALDGGLFVLQISPYPNNNGRP